MIEIPEISLFMIFNMSLLNFLSPMALIACVYVFGACICRICRPDINKTWVHLYVGVFAVACLVGVDIIYGQADELMCFICILLAQYIYATRNAWKFNTPPIAK